LGARAYSASKLLTSQFSRKGREETMGAGRVTRARSVNPLLLPGKAVLALCAAACIWQWSGVTSSPDNTNPRCPGGRRPVAVGLLRLRGGAILNEHPDLLLGERERKRDKMEIKKRQHKQAGGATQTATASQTPRQQQGRKLVALRSNPSAGTPLPPPRTRTTAPAAIGKPGSSLPEEDGGENTPLPPWVPKFTDVDNVPLEDELSAALARAHLEISRQHLPEVEAFDQAEAPSQASRAPPQPQLDVQALVAKCKYMEATGTDEDGNKVTAESAHRYDEETRELLKQVLHQMEHAPKCSEEGPAGSATGEWADVQGLSPNVASFGRTMGFKPANVKVTTLYRHPLKRPSNYRDDIERQKSRTLRQKRPSKRESCITGRQSWD